MRLVLGVDAGGTSSRAALFTMEGAPVRRGRAGGANPGALGLDQAAANLTAAVGSALAGVDPSQVEAAVVGLAGHPDSCAKLVERVVGDLLPGTPADTVGDIVTAFAAGTAEDSGTVLISGTGAIAAKITGHRATATADGYGWQLGDEGSAFWLGRAAARTAIRALNTTAIRTLNTTAVRALNTTGAPAPGPTASDAPDARTTAGSGGGGMVADRTDTGGGLVGMVVRHLVPEGLGEDPVARLAAAVYARPPLALAELAPLVSRAAGDGDPLALAIVAAAATRLAGTVAEVYEPGLPIVLAGSVLTADGPIREAVRKAVQETVPKKREGTASTAEALVVAGDVAGAAAWLAARPFLGRRESRARHPRFVHPSG
ncbi:N-acetylglucosamine kinase [Nonomuraea fuscirosea]|uniref:N-acetylglucosamine kinase n=1 Tax=Nonomuraea fuscirosea TaxID=1291556 RepID=UPI00343EE295